jgi:molybdopterin-guanine dinucleotide biosynthesis protein A
VTRDGGVSGIVLAGGAASRFGSPKLTAILDGRPLLEHTLEAVAAACDEAIVVAAPGARPVFAQRSIPVRVVHDPEPLAGPRAALLAAAGAARHPLAVVVGGDMPWIRPAFLRALVECLAADHRSAAAPILYGILQPLPFAARVEALRTLGVPAHGSLLGLLEALRVVPLPEPAWRPLDPAGASLQDVDRPEDLAGPLDLPVRGWSATWAGPTQAPSAASSRPAEDVPGPPARRSPASS